jgi:hypothetical protein
MPLSNEVWHHYIEAARRKIAIAAYHADCLKKENTSTASGTPEAPSISVQAHFEGVIVSVEAAVDQVAQAVNEARRLGLKQDKLVDQCFASLADAIPQIGIWYKEPLGRDLRRIQARMIHYSYAKTPQGPRWVVESAGTSFEGSRELVAYANTAVDYFERLKSLLPQVEHWLRSAS